MRSFLVYKQDRTESGQLDPRTYADYRTACGLALDTLGDQTSVEEISPMDFDRLHRAMRRRYGPRTTAKHIRSLKTMFTWGYNIEMLDRPVRYGGMFNPPSRSEQRRAALGGRQMFEAREVRSLVEAASPVLRAFVLLGLNAAYGQTDIAELPAPVVNDACRKGLLRFPRPKTSIDRACVLWPETIDAVRAVARDDDGRAFVTSFGNPWVREKLHTRSVMTPDGPYEELVKVNRIDSIGMEFRKLVKAAGVETKGFYALRRSFRTAVDDHPDKNAVLCVMGHEFPGMDPSYVVRIATERLQAVADRAYDWYASA